MKKINELVIFDQFRLKPKKDPYEPKKYKYKKSKKQYALYLSNWMWLHIRK